MGEYKHYLTWPCGMKESLEIKEWGSVAGPASDDRPRPCPLHREDCHRGR